MLASKSATLLPPSPDNSCLTAHVRGIQARLWQRQASTRQSVRQAEQEPREAIGPAAGDGGGPHVHAGLATQDACGQGKRRAFAFPQVCGERGVVRHGLPGEVHLPRVDHVEQERGRQIVTAHACAHGVGDGIAGARAGVGSLQRIAPPLQPDLAHRRLARDERRHARQLAREGRQRQQVRARVRRGQQRGKVTVGLARARGRDNGVICRGAWPASDVSSHVSRDAPPPPW